MIGGRRHMTFLFAVGIVIGTVLGFGVSGPVSPFLARSRESTPADKSQARTAPRPDPNLILVDAEQAQHLNIAPVQLREFRDERTAVGRIAFSDEHTTAIFAPFQGRVIRLIAKPGDVLHPGSALLVIDSPDLVQANGDLITASVAVRKAQNQLTLAERIATRQKLLYEAGAGAYKDVEQAESDLRNAEHDLKTAQGQ